MTTASVGFHCPECVKSGRQKIHTASSMTGARPVVTYALLTINILVFLASVAMGDGLMGRIGPSGLLREGVANGFLIDQRGEWYRVITAGFLHYGLVHLGFNMYALKVLGPMFERGLGPVRFTLAYVACLLGGSFGALLLTPNGLSAGASGAIFGLLGMAVISQRAVGLSIWNSGLGPILVLNFVITFGIPSISVGGHVGGFVAGLGVGWLSYAWRPTNKVDKWAIEGAIVALGVVALGVVALAGSLYAATRWTF